MGDKPKAAFYCVSSSLYFLGVVGLVNSLRLVGHAEPVFVLDHGLNPEQRELLSGTATLVSAGERREPFMLKTLAPLAHPAETMVLIDADMVATRPLRELIGSASKGGVAAIRHPEERFMAEWGAAFGSERLERHPYVSSGLVALGGAAGREVLEQVDHVQAEIDFDRTQFRTDFPGYPHIGATAPAAPRDYPFFFADQDLLNAAMSARLSAAEVTALDERLAPVPPFAGLKVLDERSLRCAYDDGTEPLVLHHYLAKPWLEPTHHGAYSRLLRRCLVGPDLAVRVPERMLPLRFRTGTLAFADRMRVDARERFRYHLAEPLAARFGSLRRRAAREGG